jgi:hypothetical protein
MGWVRCHKRRGAYLALAALMLQLALSFGHIHAQDLHLDGIARAAPHLVLATADTHGISLAQRAPSPTQNQSDDDYCAICASIVLVSTSFVSEPPKLPVPLGFARIEHAFSVTDSTATPRLFAFRSRAPPTA